MRYIDLHCDTAGRMLYENQGLKDNEFSIDIKKLRTGGAIAQVFALFIDAGKVTNPYLEFDVMYKNLMAELEKNNKDIQMVRNINELNDVEKKGKVGAILSIEGGDVLEGKIENIQKVYDKGVRIITLTWNYKNKIGYPNYGYIYKDKGLNKLGLDMVEEMERLGIIPDASHLSDAGFYDLIKICKKPFIASHSNSRTIQSHARNLTDDMIKLLAEKGGVMGINFCADFLGKSKTATVDSMVEHIKYIKDIGGIDVISLGSDFDGIENKVEINDASEMGKLEIALKREGFSDDEIEKIYYKNALRVFLEVIK